MTVGENIRRRREQLRMAQVGLGLRVGVSGDTISRVELGGDITLGRLGQIALALGCTSADLQDPEWSCPVPHELFEPARESFEEAG